MQQHGSGKKKEEERILLEKAQALMLTNDDILTANSGAAFSEHSPWFGAKWSHPRGTLVRFLHGQEVGQRRRRTDMGLLTRF